MHTHAAADALVHALTVNKTLQNLNISHNDIGAPEATAIAQGVAANATLRSLDISSNPVRSTHFPMSIQIFEPLPLAYFYCDFATNDVLFGTQHIPTI